MRAGPPRTKRARSTERDEHVLRLWCDISSLADPGGRQRQQALRDGRLAREGPRSAYLRCASWARLRRLGTRGGSTASCSLEDGEDATTTEQGIRAIPLKYDEFGNSSLVRLGLMRSYLQLTTTTGLISCDAGEHCLDSLHTGHERQRYEDIPLRRKTLQSSSPRGVLMEIGCGSSLGLNMGEMCWDGIEQRGHGTRLTVGTCGYWWYGPWILWHLRRCC